jgi:hypothetical protein
MTRIFIICAFRRVDASLTYLQFYSHKCYTRVFLGKDHGLPNDGPTMFSSGIVCHNHEDCIDILDYVHFWHEAFVWPYYQNECHSKSDWIATIFCHALRQCDGSSCFGDLWHNYNLCDDICGLCPFLLWLLETLWVALV